MYQPDKFIVLKLIFDEGQVQYRVLGSWVGGYLNGDSWRLNSGITGVSARGPLLQFRGSSGSVYEVHKDTYGVTSYTASVLGKWEADGTLEVGPKVEVLPHNTDWVNFDWTGDKYED